MSLTSTSIKRAFGIALVMLLALTTYAQTSDGDWTTYNRTYADERFSPLKEITTANLGQLRTVCTYDTGETVGFQTGPLVVSGVMYFTTFKNTYAIDAGTCVLKWKNEHPFGGPEGLGANRGLGYLDSKTGSLLGYIQPIKNDFHDWDIAAAPALITTRARRKLAATAGKDGFPYGIDRNGVELAASGGSHAGGDASSSKYGAAGPNAFVVRYQTETTTHFNTKAPLTSQRSTRFCPGSQGGTEWNGPAMILHSI